MPLGLNKTVALFQRVMDKTLKGAQDCAIAYIDDILVFSLSWEAYTTHLSHVLEALQKAELTVNLKKSQLGCMVVQYLGFCVGRAGFGPFRIRWLPYKELPFPSLKRTSSGS